MILAPLLIALTLRRTVSYPCYTASLYDATNGQYVVPDSAANLYADGGPYQFRLCQESPSQWALRINVEGANWCGVIGNIESSWLSCHAGGPGPHEVFEGRCIGKGYSNLVYGYGEVSENGVFDNWLAAASPSYDDILSFSPSRSDSFYLNWFCN